MPPEGAVRNLSVRSRVSFLVAARAACEEKDKNELV